MHDCVKFDECDKELVLVLCDIWKQKIMIEELVRISATEIAMRKVKIRKK